ncbi:hypothetical protein Amn_pb00290 (plasmid) [Aminobacter sp. Y103A]|uniref:hypothetical protein n=1 Tax=Aminobacter sp. Y103A TaxID=1870862 RepID=UPI002573898C|nr:hypothetical protein [Aminobacter sp. SS-2016]BBD41038.1 hypothetical protein Amn_pb00290 [Aminobacter sp. SS-2016]
MNEANNEKIDFWNWLYDYSPTKKFMAWSMILTAIATIILGFTAGGWVTGGSARLMAAVAARDARAELAASECVHRFIADSDATQKLTELKTLSAWQQDDFVKDGGWARFGAEDIQGADVMCAATLAAMDGIPAQEAAASTTADG